MAKTHLKLVTPATKKRAVTPRRQPNSALRSREHLTETEVDKLIEAARGNRYGCIPGGRRLFTENIEQPHSPCSPFRYLQRVPPDILVRRPNPNGRSPGLAARASHAFAL